MVQSENASVIKPPLLIDLLTFLTPLKVLKGCEILISKLSVSELTGIFWQLWLVVDKLRFQLIKD